MLFDDTYKTIEKPGKGEFRDRGSRFMGFAFPVNQENEFREHLTALKKEYYNAAHHCWAFISGLNQEIQKFNDDREPSNSAGRPILRVILSQELTNTAVIVVRYFGGKLLGVPGLIHAYETAALESIRNAGIKTKMITEQYELVVPYEQESEAFRIIRQFGLKVIQHHQEEDIRIIFDVRRSDADKVLKAISQRHLLKVKFMSQE